MEMVAALAFLSRPSGYSSGTGNIAPRQIASLGTNPVVLNLQEGAQANRVRTQLPGVGRRGDEPSGRSGRVPVVIVAEEAVRAVRPRTTQRRVQQPGGLLEAMV